MRYLILIPALITAGLQAQPDVERIGDVQIKVSQNQASETVLVGARRESLGVETSIGSAEMSKKGISNVQSGLAKITSITFTNNRISVRGLGDRYNQVTLNGLPLPSNNADRKNINLNLLPRILLDNIKVYKSYSSDQWSNSAGAQIDITSISPKTQAYISNRLQYNEYASLPSNNLNLVYGNSKSKIKYLVGINLRNDYNNLQGLTRLVNKQGSPVLDYTFKTKNSSFTPSGVLVLEYKTGKLKLKNTAFIINQNIVNDRITSGTHFDYTKKITTTRLTPRTHNLFTNQLTGEYKLKGAKLSTTLGYSRTSSGERERTQFVYLYDTVYRFNNIDKLDNHKFWSTNIESRLNAGLSLDWKNTQAGYSFALINNSFNYSQQYYDLKSINSESGTNINNPDLKGAATLWINDPASLVEGYTYINAGYIKKEYSKSDLDLGYGIRAEHSMQVVSYKDQLSPIFTQNAILNNLDLLPFINLKYKTGLQSQLKFTTSRTTIRPRFREMTPFLYTEIFAGSKIQGSPELKNSGVYNADLGMEWYPKRNEVIALTLFGKRIYNPIERINVATASGRLETYQNSDRSDVFGVELELKKKFSKISLDYNLSLLWSKISISDQGNSSVVVTNLDRPLQGSTPILSNLDIFYNINRDLNIGATYNYTGKKLFAVGVFGLGDIYQTDQHWLNLFLRKSNKKHSIGLRITNILNTKNQLTQMSDIGQVTVEEFRTGRGAAISYKKFF